MSNSVIDSVKAKYGAVAQSLLSNDHDGVQAVAEAFAYSPEELTSIPAGANMGALRRDWNFAKSGKPDVIIQKFYRSEAPAKRPAQISPKRARSSSESD